MSIIDQALNQNDEALMLQYAQGDFSAFETLYNRHKGGVYRYMMRQLNQPALAEDLFQETWGKVIRSAGQYQPSAKFTTWLYTLAKHLIIDHHRHMKVVDNIVVSPEIQSEDARLNTPAELENSLPASDYHNNSPERHLHQSHAVSALRTCIANLPSVQRECFLLKEETGLGLQDIAQIVNANFEACKSRLRYAYQNLRLCIAEKIGRELT